MLAKYNQIAWKSSSNSNISYNEIVSIKNVLKEHDDMKE